jgi:hypothetical protein
VVTRETAAHRVELALEAPLQDEAVVFDDEADSAVATDQNRRSVSVVFSMKVRMARI